MCLMRRSSLSVVLLVAAAVAAGDLLGATPPGPVAVNMAVKRLIGARAVG